MNLRRVVLTVMLCGLAAPVWAAPGTFSASGLQGWESQVFKKKTPTAYRLLDDAGVQVLEARCANSASGYVWKEKIDLTQTPKLSWRWRVDNLFHGIREREKSGDDFPARLYVVRDGGWAIWRTRSLVYVWSNGESDVQDWPSAYTAQAHVIALHSGKKGLGQWQAEQRDIRADFKTYFGEDVDHVDAVALMSDCDDSGRTAHTLFGDIKLGP
jgi:hypothetical protein